MAAEVIRRGCRLLLPAAAAALLTGCVYDPYTGTYVPCCSYYPPPGYAAGYPSPYPAAGQAPPKAASPGYPGYEVPPPGAQPGGGPIARRFAAANTARDGRLTLAEAQHAGWNVVVRNFHTIDAGGKGYVTLPEIQSWLASLRAQRAPAPGGTYPGGAYPGGAYPGGAYPGGAYPPGPGAAYPPGPGASYAPQPGATPSPYEPQPGYPLGYRPGEEMPPQY